MFSFVKYTMFFICQSFRSASPLKVVAFSMGRTQQARDGGGGGGASETATRKFNLLIL